MCEIVYASTNREINDNAIDSSEVPSSSDHGRPSKRRRMGSSSSSRREVELESECRRLRINMETLAAKLAQAQDTVVQHEVIRNEMRELYHKEIKLLETKIRGLEDQVTEDRIRIEQFEEEHRTSMSRFNRARDAQQAAEAELARLKSKSMEDLKSDAMVSSSRLQDDTDSRAYVKCEVDEGAKLEDHLISSSVLNRSSIEYHEESSTCQEESPWIDSKELRADQSMNNAEGSRVMEEARTGELSSQIKKNHLKDSGTQIEPLLRELRVSICRHEEVISRQKKEELRTNLINDSEPEASTEGWKGWDEESNVFDPKLSSFFSILNNSRRETLDLSDDEDSVSEDGNDDHDEDDDAGGRNEPERANYRQLNVGKENYVLVLDRFYKMNWTEELRKPENGKWACNTCDRTFQNRTRAVDHVWSQHYLERFKCAHCDKRFTVREKIKEHTQRKHSHVYQFRH